jgi:acetyl coenzyme A synthetase (ADP forming)-like protein
MNGLNALFNPRSVAVVGASHDPTKIGHVILRNFVEGGFKGRVFPINPNREPIMGLRVYASVLEVPHGIELAVIAVPAGAVPAVMEECGRKAVKAAIIISGGFSEVGNAALERRVGAVALKHGIRVCGPNCIGVFDPASRVDTLFLPPYKLARPRFGGIAFATQSGAIGGMVLDSAASEGAGISKFISYGNAVDVDESTMLEYFAGDNETNVIALYVEGVKDGRRFMAALRKATAKKPVIVLKAGRTEKGAAAARSHTGSLAGSDAVFDAVLKQAGATRALTCDELFDFSRSLSMQPRAAGKRVQIITNGGGIGVLAADAVAENGLQLAEMSRATKKALRNVVPAYAILSNPMDLVGDADAHRYNAALDAALADDGIDALLVVVLFQTVGVESEVVDVIVKHADRRAKPIVAVTAGGDYTRIHKRMLEAGGVPTYSCPSAAARALALLCR